MPPAFTRHRTLFQSYGERSEHSNNTPLATYLLRLMHIKRTNLCVSADVSTSAELLRLADEVGEYICVLKTHADIISDFTERTARALTVIARRRKFVIFEDRKFGDIGSTYLAPNTNSLGRRHGLIVRALRATPIDTVELQYIGGPLSIVQWAPIVNAHIFPGPAVIVALAQGAHKAILRHNTSVSTSISASPTPSAVGRDDDDSVATDETRSDADGDAKSSSDESEDDAAYEEEQAERARANDVRVSRKQSVVSVSTTISMKSETVSPPATLRPSLSRGSTASDDELDDLLNSNLDPDTVAQYLDELGPLPFYRGLLLLAEMSSRDNLMTREYTNQCLINGRAHRDFVIGFVAQRSLNTEPDDNFIIMTPGVQLAAGGDALGQVYNTPRSLITDAGSDIVIVGRGVLNAQNRRAAAAEYRIAAWRAYETRVRAGRKAQRA